VSGLRRPDGAILLEAILYPLRHLYLHLDRGRPEWKKSVSQSDYGVNRS